MFANFYGFDIKFTDFITILVCSHVHVNGSTFVSGGGPV